GKGNNEPNNAGCSPGNRAGSIPTPASKQNQGLKKIASDSQLFFGTIWDSSLGNTIPSLCAD
ncbi:MAG: hypothetical protein ACXWCK_31875, partial [Burkholderiales bacterium]